jgi:transposase
MVEKRLEISEFDRGRAIGAHNAGMSIRDIADMYNISKTTIHRTIKDYEAHELTTARPRSGRPQALDNRDKRHLVQIVKKNHFTALDQITVQIQDITQKSISASTI